jgi:hypothetical protein
MNSSLVAFLVGVEVAVIGFVLYAVATLRYRITDEAVEVLILGWCARRIRLDDIESVRRGSVFWNEHWTNFKLWNSVMLRRKTGVIRNFVITPDNPAAFIDELTRRLKREEH